MTTTPDIGAASDVVALASGVVDTAARHVAANGGVEQRRSENQTIGYDLAHAASVIENAKAVLEYGTKGETEAAIACAFVADAVHDVIGRPRDRHDRLPRHAFLRGLLRQLGRRRREPHRW